MKVRYIRVSTGNQKTARQEAKAKKDEKSFIDVVSGSVPFSEREQGKNLLNEVENGTINYVSVSSIDRLGRNTFDVLTTLEFLKEKNVTVRVDNLGIESIIDGKENQVFSLITSVMANISQMERESILERQREGIALAKMNGIYKGREKGSFETEEAFLSKYKDVIKNLKKGNSLRDTAKICNCSPGTVLKVKKILDSKEKR